MSVIIASVLGFVCGCVAGALYSRFIHRHKVTLNLPPLCFECGGLCLKVPNKEQK